MSAFKLEAVRQAEEHSQKEAQEKAKSAEVDTKEDADADREVEEVVPPQCAKGKCCHAWYMIHTMTDIQIRSDKE
jgi:hypothetical protein